MKRLSTMILACSLSAGAQAQPRPPVQLTGSVLGSAPAKLEVVLLDRTGVTGAWTAAQVDFGNSRRSYVAQLDGEALPRDRSGLSLGFRSDGKLCSKPLALSDAPLPARVDVLDGEPRAASHAFPTVYAEVDEAKRQIQLTAVLSRLGTGPVQGTLQWSAAGVPAVQRALEARPDAVSVSRIATTIPAGTTLPQLWEALWMPASNTEPEAFRRTEARSGIRVLADVLAEGSKPTGATLYAGALTASAGELLGVDLELPAGTTLGGRSLIDSKASPDASSPQFPLDRCRVTPLPGGKLWANGRWLIPRDIAFTGLAVSGGSALPDGWAVRRIFVFVSPDADASY